MLWALVRCFPWRTLAALLFPLQIAVPVLFLMNGLAELAAVTWLLLGALCVSIILPKEVVRVHTSLPISRREIGRTLWFATVACMIMPCVFTLILFTVTGANLLPTRLATWQAELFLALLALTLTGLAVGPLMTTLRGSTAGRGGFSVTPLPNPTARRWVFLLGLVIPVVAIGTRGVAYCAGLPQASVLWLQLLVLVLATPISLYCLVMGFRRPEHMIERWLSLQERARDAVLPGAKARAEGSEKDGWGDEATGCDYFRAQGLGLGTFWRSERWNLVILLSAAVGALIAFWAVGSLEESVASAAIFPVVLSFTSVFVRRSHMVAQSLRFLRSLPLPSRRLAFRYALVLAMAAVDVVPLILIFLLWGGHGIEKADSLLCLALAAPPCFIVFGVIDLLFGEWARIGSLVVAAALFGASILWGCAWVMPVVLTPVAVWSVYAMIRWSSRAYQPRRTPGEG